MVDSYCRYDRRFLILQPNKCQTTRVHVRLNLEHTSESRIVVQGLFLMPPHANPQETFTISSSDFFVLFKLTTRGVYTRFDDVALYRLFFTQAIYHIKHTSSMERTGSSCIEFINSGNAKKRENKRNVFSWYWRAMIEATNRYAALVTLSQFFQERSEKQLLLIFKRQNNTSQFFF